ncbi:NAD-dependent epimerase/dehydratase family protein [Chitinophaga sp. Hz27]|uniref:NAD-dependent epimerase/dehydratase family protein n=1 Tax=Chitinophaga sp. Hz27 TaxID=3347169 RepID=UPI0035DDF9E4
MNARSLVIGANSFIGSNLITSLAETSDVTGVYNHSRDRLVADVPYVSIGELYQLEPNFDHVYIVSAFIRTGTLSDEDREQLYKVNVEMVARICRRFSNARIILCSSVSVYDLEPGIISENSSIGGLNEYGISKRWSEKIVAATPNHAIVRFSSIYGKGMNPGTIIPAYIDQATEKKEIVVFGKGERLQNYLHVQDAVNYLIAAANHNKNEILLACATESVSNRALAELIASQTASTVTFNGNDHALSFRYNNSTTNQELNYRPIISLSEGIKEMIKWKEKKF